MIGQFSRSRFRKSLGRFARNTEGAMMIEFAFIFPIVLMLTFGVMEISLYMVSMVTLEGGLKEASRYGITSQNPGALSVADLAQVPTAFKATNDPRTEQIGLILNQYTLNLIDLDKAGVDYKTYDSFMLIKDGEPYTDMNGNGQYDGPSSGLPGIPVTGEPYQNIACPLNSVRDGPKDTGSSVGVAGQIVVYIITYNWKVMTPIVGQWLGRPDPMNAGRYIIPMKATMVVKNEPALSGSTFAC